MKRLIGHIRRSFACPTERRRQDGLTAVEYEAGCLIAHEGRAAYARARQQAFYFRARGGEQGFRLWLHVAVEFDRMAGARAKRAQSGQGEPSKCSTFVPGAYILIDDIACVA